MMEGVRAFVALVEREEDLDLGRAALAIAQAEYPLLDPAPSLAQLDRLAARVRAALPRNADARGTIAAMNRVLFEEEGFRGNLEDYYDPQNSYLNRVLERRRGIPITLSILYLEVGRRVGLPLVGVGLPGHFLVKYTGPDEELLIDPFYQGVLVDHAEAQRRLDAVYSGRVTLNEQFLRAVSQRDILARMLYNLKRIHVRGGDTRRTLAVLDMLLALQPHSFEDLRDRGLLRYEHGDYDAALRDLTGYRALLPAAEDAAAVERAIRACQRLGEARR